MAIFDHDPDFPETGLYFEVDSAQGLANSMVKHTDKPIYEPDWPADAFRRRYVLDFDQGDRGYAIYHILTWVPDHPYPLAVRGSTGAISPPPQPPEWSPIPELAEINGWARSGDGPGPHVIASAAGMNLQLTFRSTEEAINAARTLREIQAEGPGLLTWMSNSDDGDSYDNAQDLADAIHLPVHEPHWPDYAGPRRYVVPQPPPWSSSPEYKAFDLPRMVSNYDILAVTPGEESIIMVSGNVGKDAFDTTGDDWWAIPGLAHLHGVARTENDPAEVIVEISGMSVSLSGFRSTSDAVQAALSLAEYRPRGRETT